MSAVILSAAAASVAACGGSGNDNAGAAGRQSQTSSQTSSQSSSQNGTQSATQANGGSTSQSSFTTSEGTVLIYGGSSDTTLTVQIEKDSRLLWSNDDGRPFRISGSGVNVDSSAGSGEVPLPSGRHRLQVSGDVWTIVVRPG